MFIWTVHDAIGAVLAALALLIFGVFFVASKLDNWRLRRKRAKAKQEG